MMKALVLLTCFNRKEKTIKCIESLLADDMIDFDFIVVDDGSKDGTALELQKYINVDVIKGNGSLYYSGGMRVAIEKAKERDLSQYSYVIFVNDDVEFYRGAISRLISFNDDEDDIAAGATCDDNGNLSYGGAVKTSSFKPSFKNVMSTSEKVYCDTFCANCVLIKRDVFKNIDNIDPKYRHAMGDFDYGFTARRAGYTIVASDFYVGVCNDNPKQGSWRDTGLTRKERLLKKESVKGLPFKEYFHYLAKNHGLVVAVVYSLIPYVHILINR